MTMKLLMGFFGLVVLAAVNAGATPLVAAPPLQYEGAITAPSSGQTVSGSVAVTGTANHPDFWKYEVRVAAGTNTAVPDNQWYRLTVREQAVVNGQLAIWDTTALADGPYAMRLRVVRADGQWQDFDVVPLYVVNTPPTQPPPPPTQPPPPTATQPPPTATQPPPPTETPAPTATADSSPTPVGSPTPAGSRTPIPTLTPAASGSPRATLTPGGLPTLTPLGGSATETPVATNTPLGVALDNAATLTAQSDNESDNPLAALVDESGEETVEPVEESSEAVAPTAEAPEIPDTFQGRFDTTALLGSCLMGAAVTVGVALLVGLLYLARNLLALFR